MEKLNVYVLFFAKITIFCGSFANFAQKFETYN